MTSASSLRRPRVRSLAVVVFVMAVGSFGIPSVIAAEAQESAAPEIVAPVQSATTDGPLAVTSFWVDFADTPTVIIELASPLEVPVVGSYRLSVLMGDPSAGRFRSSLVSTDGVIVGTYEEGDGDEWASLGGASVNVAAATVSIELSPDYVGDNAQIWVEATIDDGDGSSSFTTPIFPWDDLLESGARTMYSASTAWSVADQQPPPAPVEVSAELSLVVDGDVLQIGYDGPVPTEIGSVGVAKVVDVLRVADQFDRRAETPFLIAIDHTESTVALLDGTALLPAEIPNDGEWLLRGLSPAGIGADDTVDIGLTDLLAVIGADADEVGFGVARSITLDDGTVVRADGAVASLTWLRTEAPVETDGSTTTTAADEVAVADESSSSSSGIPLGLIVIAVVVVGVSIAVVFFMRDRERRHEEASSGPVLRSALPVAPGDDRDELDDLTDEFFGD